MQDSTQTDTEPDEAPGLGEREEVPGGISVGDSVPEMPPPAASAPGGGLTVDDIAQPTTTEDTTGDRATGLTGLRD